MSLFELVKSEIRAILTNPVVVLTVFGGVVFTRFSTLCPTVIRLQGNRRLVSSILTRAKPVISLNVWLTRHHRLKSYSAITP